MKRPFLNLSTLVHKFANVFFLYASKRPVRNDINHGKGRHSFYVEKQVPFYIEEDVLIDNVFKNRTKSLKSTFY
jgi:hypothetical protein